jgi:hypothetical protein
LLAKLALLSLFLSHLLCWELLAWVFGVLSPSEKLEKGNINGVITSEMAI